jgi:hypothetical protein
MTEIDLAWTAGIIDGEGSIFVMTQKRLDRERDTNYILRVSVQSTDPYMSAELKRMFPDGAEFGVQRRNNPNHSDTLKWQLNGRKAAKFLTMILPYMRVKHEQAKLAIEFQQLKKHWRHMTEDGYTQQEIYCAKLKQAKQDLKIGRLVI